MAFRRFDHIDEVLAVARDTPQAAHLSIALQSLRQGTIFDPKRVDLGLRSELWRLGELDRWFES
jgi:hypothetical protein